MASNRHPWTRNIGGVIAQSEEGRMWKWHVGRDSYCWLKRGTLEIKAIKGIYTPIGFFRDLQSAVSWTVGYHEGQRDARLGTSY